MFNLRPGMVRSRLSSLSCARLHSFRPGLVLVRSCFSSSRPGLVLVRSCFSSPRYGLVLVRSCLSGLSHVCLHSFSSLRPGLVQPRLSSLSFTRLHSFSSPRPGLVLVRPRLSSLSFTRLHSFSSPRPGLVLVRSCFSSPRPGLVLVRSCFSSLRPGLVLVRPCLSSLSFTRLHSFSSPRPGLVLVRSCFSSPRPGLVLVRPRLFSLSFARLHSFSSLPEEGLLIFQSESSDVHQNLALEDWIESNVDLTNRRLFLLWRSHAAVVIGRHQNPWAECNQEAMRRAGVPLARRRSGGGTVYHDSGNLNLTFFSCRKLYDRRRNLKVVTDTLKELRPELDVKATERLDIVLNGKYKISGSASRLSRGSSYHHLTLLHSADGSALHSVLRPSVPGLRSNATPSVVSAVTNLIDHAPSLTWAELIQGLVRQFNTEFGFSSPLTLLDPTDESLFPGISRVASELRSWDWTFGKTPKFTVETEIKLWDSLTLERTTAQLHVEVKNGLVSQIHIHLPEPWLPQRLLQEVCGVLTGERFCPHRAAAAVSALARSEGDETRRKLLDLSNALVNVMKG